MTDKLLTAQLLKNSTVTVPDLYTPTTVHVSNYPNNRDLFHPPEGGLAPKDIVKPCTVKGTLFHCQKLL